MVDRKVDKAEFEAFIRGYPKPLVKDVDHRGEPSRLTYNDFSDGKTWPASVVATVILYEDSYPNEDGTKRPNVFVL